MKYPSHKTTGGLPMTMFLRQSFFFLPSCEMQMSTQRHRCSLHFLVASSSARFLYTRSDRYSRRDSRYPIEPVDEIPPSCASTRPRPQFRSSHGFSFHLQELKKPVLQRAGARMASTNEIVIHDCIARDTSPNCFLLKESTGYPQS